MTAIERTAYPRFNRQPTSQELVDLYTPTTEEIAFAQIQTADFAGRFRLLLLLKCFQRLGYFPPFEFIPSGVIAHLRNLLNLPASVSAVAPLRSQRRYQQLIRKFLDVKLFDSTGHQTVAIVIAQAATTMDHPADLINVAIEELVKERYELPAFSTLDRLVGNVRSVTNTRLFQQVASRLTSSEQAFLDSLLQPASALHATPLNLLKSPPKSARLSHIVQLQSKFDQIMSFGDAQRLLSGLAPSKIKSFAAQARALDISDLRDIRAKKRYTLLVCLLYQAQVKTRDHLVEMFLKRMQAIHNHARQRLVDLREKHLKQTEGMLDVLAQILEASVESEDEQTLGTQVQALLKRQGGAASLLERCQEIVAFNSDNHLPFVRQFFSRYRKPLLALVRSLEIQSTSQDQSLMDALQFVLKFADRRSPWLPGELDLGFMSDRWRRLVIERRDDQVGFVRSQLEVCILRYLAAELKTGDACVTGSEQYADFREQLLSMAECEAQLEVYGQELGIGTTAEAFVETLQTQLIQRADSADRLCQDGTQVTINDAGEPVLKRTAARVKPDGAEQLEHEIWQRLPERSVLDILCNVEHWIHWTRHFGLASGSQAKVDNFAERCILTVFGYGCNLGPYQMARHTQGQLDAQILSRTNRLHIQTPQIEAAMRDIINAYNRLNLPKCWGSGKRAAADGSKFQIHENSLMSTFSMGCSKIAPRFSPILSMRIPRGNLLQCLV
jgi:hypothetical protein